jgi:RNA polymerase sigma-70 factor (ECF subfamily)
MTDPAGDTTHLLHLLKGGDEQAREALLTHACQRLCCLTRRMLQDYPGVRRWEETDDVFQNAMIRLHRALSKVSLASSQHFWNLAAQQIRWELIDLARNYLGPDGQRTRQHTDWAEKERDAVLQNQPDASGEPSSLDGWTQFHEQIGRLPADEKGVFDLLWFDGFSQDQAADVLGVSLRTVKRRWQSARFLLSRALSGDPPR